MINIAGRGHPRPAEFLYMRKVIIFVVVILSIALLSTQSLLSPVYAQSATPTPTSTPPPAITVTGYSWTIGWPYGGSFNGVCTNDTAYSGTCDGTLTATGTSNYNFDTWGSISLSTGTDAIIYIRIVITSTQQINMTITDWGGAAVATGVNTIDGSCHVIPGKSCGVNWHIATSGIHDAALVDGTTIFVQYSTAPLDQTTQQQCDNTFQTGAGIASGMLAATNESGDVIAVVSGDYYLLETSGGPWHNAPGALDRYDVAISWDGTSWQPLLGYSGQGQSCEGVPGSPQYIKSYIQAESSTLYIRVNDVTGQFADNDGSINYAITAASIPPATTCADQYALTAAYTGNIFATSMTGGVVGLPIQPGQPYAIEITDPPWSDGNTSSVSYAAQIAKTDGDNATTMGLWQDLETFTDASCVENLGSGRYRVYFSGVVSAPTFFSLRARDTSWIDNAGSLNYTLYNATYTPNYPACASRFEVDQFALTGRIGAWGVHGYPMPPQMPLSPGFWEIETSAGPWSNGIGGAPLWDLEISTDNGATWIPLNQFGICAYQYDMHHWRVIFQHIAGTTYLLRVNDPGGVYTDNIGAVEYNLYSILDEQQSNQTCSNIFSIGNQIETNTISPTSATGRQLTSIQPGAWYAVEASTTTWADEVPNVHTDVQLTNQPDWMIQNWFELSAYPGAACAETIGNHTRIYFNANDGDTYWMRANDADGNFGPNSGNITYIVYDAIQNVPPPSPVCSNNYYTGVWLTGGDIYPRLDTGVVLPFTGGKTYMLETSNGPWNDGTMDRYDVQVSEDGITWYTPFEAPFVSCAQYLPDGDHIRLYITANLDSTYYVRVNDQSGVFADNTGLITYQIALTGNVNVGSEPPPLPPQGFDVGCNAECLRPDDPLAVSNWLEYGRCRITRFFSWCREHTLAMQSVSDAFLNREPFATISKFIVAIGQVRDEVYALDWGVGGGSDPGGAPGGSTWNADQILPALDNNSPYMGGKIKIMDPGEQYTTTCNSQMITVVGPLLGAGICFGANIMDKVGVLSWFQFIWDIVMILILVYYLWARWINSGVGK